MPSATWPGTERVWPAHRSPSGIYALILHHLFRSEGDELDEERIIKSATGIRDTEVWKRLFKFQRDGVVGAIVLPSGYGSSGDRLGIGALRIPTSRR